ncbi:MAG: isoprenoid biosynthesis glyoxalase ElbB [Saprospiraceae bacterium]|nr:isoprenoid biosynthesis glyoxalase ElbB [Saprospiraceae bacterium]
MKKFAVVLSGCGVFDGAEIHEAIMTLLAIKKQGADYDIFAPNIPQHHVINHITGEEMNEKRNVLIESARIARGKISDLKDFKAENYDALIFPGGFGAAKNLSTFAFKGADSEVNSDVEIAIKSMFKLKNPIGALCIAPAVLAKVLGNIEVTIGQDAGTAEQIEKAGAKHITSNNGEVVIDEKNKIFTNPCYMLEANIVHIEEGAGNVVEAMMRFV